MVGHSSRASRWSDPMELAREIRYGLRTLRRESSYASTAILTLGLGIGANVAMVSLAGRMLVDPPPNIADAKRVVRLELLFTDRAGQRFTMSTTSFPVFTSLGSGTRSFAAMAAVASGTMVLGRGEEARPVAALKVSGRYFGLLGTE